MSQLKQSIHR